MTRERDRCDWCHRWRPLAELILVRRHATGAIRHVCRPMLAPCFRHAVGSAAVEAIQAADPAAERAAFALWPALIPPNTGGFPG